MDGASKETYHQAGYEELLHNPVGARLQVAGEET